MLRLQGGGNRTRRDWKGAGIERGGISGGGDKIRVLNTKLGAHEVDLGFKVTSENGLSGRGLITRGLDIYTREPGGRRCPWD